MPDISKKENTAEDIKSYVYWFNQFDEAITKSKLANQSQQNTLLSKAIEIHALVLKNLPLKKENDQYIHENSLAFDQMKQLHTLTELFSRMTIALNSQYKLASGIHDLYRADLKKKFAISAEHFDSASWQNQNILHTIAQADKFKINEISWLQYLGLCVGIFSVLILIATGVLLAIPSGGTSLLAVTAALAGVTLTQALIIGASVGGAGVVLGATGFFAASAETTLLKKIKLDSLNTSPQNTEKSIPVDPRKFNYKKTISRETHLFKASEDETVFLINDPADEMAGSELHLLAFSSDETYQQYIEMNKINKMNPISNQMNLIKIANDYYFEGALESEFGYGSKFGFYNRKKQNRTIMDQAQLPFPKPDVTNFIPILPYQSRNAPIYQDIQQVTGACYYPNRVRLDLFFNNFEQLDPDTRISVVNKIDINKLRTLLYNQCCQKDQYLQFGKIDLLIECMSLEQLTMLMSDQNNSGQVLLTYFAMAGNSGGHILQIERRINNIELVSKILTAIKKEKLAEITLPITKGFDEDICRNKTPHSLSLLHTLNNNLSYYVGDHRWRLQASTAEIKQAEELEASYRKMCLACIDTILNALEPKQLYTLICRNNAAILHYLLDGIRPDNEINSTHVVCLSAILNKLPGYLVSKAIQLENSRNESVESVLQGLIEHQRPQDKEYCLQLQTIRTLFDSGNVNSVAGMAFN